MAYRCLAAEAEAAVGGAGGGGDAAAGPEAAAGVGLGKSSSRLPASKVLVAGALRPPRADLAGDVDADSADPGPQVPFLVVTKAPGVTLGSCMERLTQAQWLAVAAAAGRSLAALHRAPLPGTAAGAAGAAGGAAAQPASGRGGPASGSVGGCGVGVTAWIAKDGVVFSSRHGRVDLREEQQRRAGGVALFPGPAAPAPAAPAAAVAAAVSQPAASAGQSDRQATGAVPGSSVGAETSPATAAACPCCQAWQPFVSFLQRQCRNAVLVHRSAGTLPPQLLELLQAYLPADPAVLVGCCSGSGGAGSSGGSAAATVAGQPGSSSCGGCGGVAPTWVHGDLTAENLLLGSRLHATAEEPAGNGGSAQCKGSCTAGAAAGAGAGRSGSGAAGGEAASTGFAAAPCMACAEAGSVALIDLGDSGQGDPLWDLLPLFLRSFK